MIDTFDLLVEITESGERRAFSRQYKGLPTRDGSIPTSVHTAAFEFVNAMIDIADIYSPPIGVYDYPSRGAFYTVHRNGELILSSFSRKPIRPEVTA